MPAIKEHPIRSLGHFSRKKSSNLWQGNCIKSDMVHLGHFQLSKGSPL
jgi:hypothetical protein